MAVMNPPIFMQSQLHPSDRWRQADKATFGNRGGVVGAGLLVAQKSGGANMSVDVAEGFLVLPGTENGYQGVYLCETQGVTNKTVTTSDVTNARIDLVVARIRDSSYSGATDAFTLEVLAGTPAGSPAAPSVGAGSTWVLGVISVAANASSIIQANILDARLGGGGYVAQAGSAAALGGVISCTSSLRPSSPYAGMVIWETDTKLLRVYNGSAWETVGATAGTWTAMPLGNSWANFGGGNQVAQYRKLGDMVQLRGAIASGTFNTTITTLPSGFRPPANIWAAAGLLAGTGWGRINIGADGTVVVDNTTTGTPTNGYLSLTGIAFSTSS